MTPASVADRLGPLAGAVDDELRLDVALVGADTGGAPVVSCDTRSPGPAPRRWTPRSRAPLASDWVRSVGLARPSPGSQIAPSDVVGLDQRVALPCLVRGEQLHSRS